MAVPQPDFTRLLTDGGPYPFPHDRFRARIRVLPGVPLSLPSGKVIAIEPFMVGGDDGDELAFTEQVKPGTYPVVLSEIDLIDDGGVVWDTRVAAARLVIRDAPVARWELAHTAEQDRAELDDDEHFGFPVDGGLGCFLDAETYRVVGEEEDFANRVMRTMYPRFGGTADGGVVPAPVTLAVGDEPHAVVYYSTGFGDGVYATWIGFTAAGDVGCFLTDFQTLGDEHEGEGGDDEYGNDAPTAPVTSQEPVPLATALTNNALVLGVALSSAGSPLLGQATLSATTDAVPPARFADGQAPAALPARGQRD
ncbi:DUF4241 domain-containing protein [Streptomyces sp. NPDC007856]|uniref:DUF4241 domain-containing protein n=1 Tax=Streptomyces sp. NPDC007856 TaxID=3364781 RepID=UPI00367A423E